MRSTCSRELRIMMNVPKFLAVLGPVVVLLSVSAGASDEAPQKAVEWHVAVQGNDAQAGTALKPFATAHRALEEVARLRAAKDDRPAAIVLHQGTHEIRRPLEIGPQHASSGSLTIRAAENAHPVLSGGRRLSGWQRSDDGNLQLNVEDVTGGHTFRELFVNGQRRPRARHPNIDYLRVAEPFPDKRSGFTFNAGDIPAAVQGGAELVFLHDWSISRVAVKSIDHQSGRLTTSAPIGVAGDFFSVD